MKQETLKTLADGATISAISTGVSVRAGWLDVVNTYAPAIGAIATVFFGLIGILFYYLTYKKGTQADENKKDITDLQESLVEHKAETKENFDALSKGIDKILENQSSKRRFTDEEKNK